MNLIYQLSSLFLLFVNIILPASARGPDLHAGEGGIGGNGDYCTQVNGKDQRVEFEIGFTHPMQDKIIQLLKSKPIPRPFLNELLQDLSETLVVTSGELITLQDLSARYVSQITQSSTVFRYDSNGALLGTEKTITETYSKKLPDLGIYIDEVGYQVTQDSNHDLNQVYARAVTQTNPQKKVIYFKPFVNPERMTEAEMIRLVFHEQAHRLKSLVKLRGEREAEGWAKRFYDYLTGNETPESFEQFLINTGVPIIDFVGFPNPVRRDKDSYYSDFFITILPTDILNAAVQNQFYFSNYRSTYLINISKDAFREIPALRNSDQNIEIGARNDQELAWVDSFISNIRKQNSPFILELRAFYKVNIIETSPKLLTQEVDIKLMLSTNRSQQFIERVASNFDFKTITTGLKFMYPSDSGWNHPQTIPISLLEREYEIESKLNFWAGQFQKQWAETLAANEDLAVYMQDVGSLGPNNNTGLNVDFVSWGTTRIDFNPSFHQFNLVLNIDSTNQQIEEDIRFNIILLVKAFEEAASSYLETKKHLDIITKRRELYASVHSTFNIYPTTQFEDDKLFPLEQAFYQYAPLLNKISCIGRGLSKIKDLEIFSDPSSLNLELAITKATDAKDQNRIKFQFYKNKIGMLTFSVMIPERALREHPGAILDFLMVRALLPEHWSQNQTAIGHRTEASWDFGTQKGVFDENSFFKNFHFESKKHAKKALEQVLRVFVACQ